MIKKRVASKFQDIETNTKITDRGYQLEGIQRLKEAFDQKKRRGLLVQATGTGKTKVLSLLIAWCYFNKLYEENYNLSKNFLLIARQALFLGHPS